MPDFPIVDAHVHLYDVERFSYGWLAGVPKINRSYGLGAFDAARALCLVRGTAQVGRDERSWSMILKGFAPVAERDDPALIDSILADIATRKLPADEQPWIAAWDEFKSM